MAKKPAFVPEGIITPEMMNLWTPAQRDQFNSWVSKQLAQQFITSFAIKAGLIVTIHMATKQLTKK